MSEESVLTESVPPNLSTSNVYHIQFVDGVSNTHIDSLAIPILENDGFQIDLTPFIPQPSCYLLEDFYKSLQEIIGDIQHRQGIVDTARIQVVQEYPHDDFSDYGDAVISFKILSREPAKMDPKGTGRPQRGFNFAYNYNSPSDPNKVFVVESRPIDHMIELSVWAKTATIANEKALWLERNLIRETWAFKIRGVDKFFWEGRGPDNVQHTSGTRIHQRPLKFRVRLIEFMPRATNQIKDFTFVINNTLI